MIRVVIVDDERKLAEALKEFLAPRGFQVWTAGTGEEALPLIQTHQPDVLLLDLNLGDGGLQGLDVLRTVNTLSRATRVIVISGYPGEDRKSAALRLGARRYLEKPLNLQALRDALNEIAAFLP